MLFVDMMLMEFTLMIISILIQLKELSSLIQKRSFFLKKIIAINNFNLICFFFFVFVPLAIKLIEMGEDLYPLMIGEEIMSTNWLKGKL